MIPKTYLAMQTTPQGNLVLTEKQTVLPTAHQVLIQVEACGVCGADLGDIKHNLQTPRVIGHEVVGWILAKGEAVSKRWQVGQRVGVGRLGGHCHECDACRAGQFVHCAHQSYIGASRDGGYAELMIVNQTGLVAIPESLNSTDAAPLLCAGLATFNALRNSDTKAGDTVAVLGTGGLGHLAVQYAQKMGFEVVSIGRQDLSEKMTSLGAHHYVNLAKQSAVDFLRELGGADLILSTITDAETIGDVAKSLKARGKLLLLGASGEPLALPLNRIVGKEQRIQGSLTGTPFDAECTLKFSVLSGVKPQVEIFPLTKANEAIARLKSGKARFRIVLNVNQNKTTP
ncbi:alcohol dehydrogenase catalytic domain-containing protein [Aggregatibacter actinomycetemcomitans]|uniref:alcohol dehydrogenase n=1 Tax=Aggregatibacter actinomycetemcomitans TaxID=714 RepID=UPI00197BC1A9|nr:alcohol dehydrogenase [Aggregatibacter actinomycetemcomitans]MBN6069356.1 alcohol dehydrogenase catalytic domain-containing protein [Aggregatibacter actinomycetemcomitans]MBN6085230.1 alcohol dehydrogenase catalytic domain-containing protein [Aggregatibacter actinomycetemcomitans]